MNFVLLRRATTALQPSPLDSPRSWLSGSRAVIKLDPNPGGTLIQNTTSALPRQ
jgi:hypothetical protein